VGIQRQVPAVEIDIVGQQSFQAAALHAADHWRFVFPEIAVMDNHRIRLQPNGFIQQRLAGRHPGDDLCTVSRPSTCRPLGAKSLMAALLSLSFISCSSSLFFIATPADNQGIQRHNITRSIRVVDSPQPALTMTF
jgi:hypothetical protein